MKHIRLDNPKVKGFAINLCFGSSDNPDDNKCGRILAIPYSIAIVDMFQEGVLTPYEKMGAATKNDVMALLSWKIINETTDKNISAAPREHKIGTLLLLCGAAYESITTFNNTFVSNALSELKAYEKEQIKLEECYYFSTLLDNTLDHIDIFFNEYMIKLNKDNRRHILAYLFEQYCDIAKQVCENVPGIKHNKSV